MARKPQRAIHVEHHPRDEQPVLARHVEYPGDNIPTAARHIEHKPEDDPVIGPNQHHAMIPPGRFPRVTKGGNG